MSAEPTSRFDPRVLDHDRVRRRRLLAIAERALDAVDSERAVADAVERDGSMIHVARQSLDVDAFDRVVVIGFGKAAVPMGRSIANVLAGLPLSEVLITSQSDSAPPFDVIVGDHPIPGEGSVAGGRKALQLASGVGRKDLVIVLVSGGGSALLAAPASGLDIGDLQETVRLLLRCGASVVEVNTVRKHLSAVKGGRLGEALAAAGGLVTLVVSDVVANQLESIASGPTIPDSSSYGDALTVLDHYRLRQQIPEPILAHLTAGARGDVPEVAADAPIFDRQIIKVVADAPMAAHHAAWAAQNIGLTAVVVTTELEGEARDVARRLIRENSQLAPGAVAVYAGETTVTVTGDGNGGRNQEFALAASIELEGYDDLILLSLATDGVDGTVPVAGAFADGTALRRGAAQRLDAADHLRRNDSYPFLDAIGDVVLAGPTGANVGDLVLVYHDAGP